ncbi:MAG: AAA family ATPase [Patescibacteria group bacterium]
MEEERRLKAQTIRRFLNPDAWHRSDAARGPFVVEFDGPPSTGKTTVVTEVDKFFRKEGLRVFCPQEGAQAIRHIPRGGPDYNLATMLYILNTLMHVNRDGRYDLVLLDRGIFDSYCWMAYHSSSGEMTAEHEKAVQQFVLLEYFVRRIDVAVFVFCDPVVALKRERRFEIGRESTETTNPRMLRLLEEIYRKAYDALSPLYPQLYAIQTDELPGKKMTDHVVDFIQAALIERVKRAS